NCRDYWDGSCKRHMAQTSNSLEIWSEMTNFFPQFRYLSFQFRHFCSKLFYIRWDKHTVMLACKFLDILSSQIAIAQISIQLNKCDVCSFHPTPQCCVSNVYKCTYIS